MNLYNQTVSAESEFSTYRSPNIDAWIEAIDPVLKAAGQCAIGRDTVEDITVWADALTIRTTYSVRGCAQTNEMRLPISVLKADDPIQAATRYREGHELEEAKIQLMTAQRELTKWAKEVALLEARMTATA